MLDPDILALVGPDDIDRPMAYLVLHIRELSSDPKSLRTILSKLALRVWWDV